jgi:peptidoglycan hydrolase-like protein with peptidoglycan-binding domain
MRAKSAVKSRLPGLRASCAETLKSGAAIKVPQKAKRRGAARMRGPGIPAAALIFLALAAASGSAYGEASGGPTPAPAGAAVYFVDVKNGQTLPAKTTIHFGLRNMGVAPAGLDRPNAGHHHLIIDTPTPALNQPIPNDFNHLHFGAGQTEAEVSLSPGKHTLQLIVGDKDHIPHSPPIMSEIITVTVVDSGQVAAAAIRRPSSPEAKVYLENIADGQHIPSQTIVRFGLLSMGVAPAGVAKPNTGHHHLLIDTPLPPLDQPIPNDFNHLHFGGGQTEARLTLSPGPHSLQLLLGDENHVPHDPPVLSQPIKVVVGAAEARRMLRRGAQGETVKELQVLLGVPADGAFGRLTEEAVIRLQRRQKIAVDGIVGPETWTVIDTMGNVSGG